MSKYLLAIVFIFVGCYAPNPLFRRGHWEGERFIVTDGLPVSLHVVFTDQLIQGPDSVITLEGVVEDSVLGQGVDGATILKRGSNVGWSTDYKGRFKLVGLSTKDTLIISAVVYGTKVISVGGIVKKGRISW